MGKIVDVRQKPDDQCQRRDRDCLEELHARPVDVLPRLDQLDQQAGCEAIQPRRRPTLDLVGREDAADQVPPPNADEED